MYSRRKEALEQKRTQTMLYDAKMKLNNVIGYYRNDWHWPSWKYLEIEKQRVHQNNARLLRADRMNRTRNLPTGSDLLQQSMFGDWNNIDERSNCQGLCIATTFLSTFPRDSSKR
jgi:hypothetical protein